MAETTELDAPGVAETVAPDLPYSPALWTELERIYSRSLDEIGASISGLPDDVRIMSSWEERVAARDQARIGVTMILRNAQSELLGLSPEREGTVAPGILDRLLGEAWDVVVVDRGSDDATPHIATEKGARVYSTTWNGDFAAARNFAIERARPGTRFFLHLDGDEYISREHIAYLNARCTRADDRKAFAVPLEIKNDDARVEGSITVQTRLFPALWKDGSPRARFHGKIHEQVRPSMLEAGV